MVVIQPLISLMKDQMMTLEGKKINVFRLITGKTAVKSDMSDSAWLNVITQYCTVSHLIAIELAILQLDLGLATCAILHI